MHVTSVQDSRVTWNLNVAESPESHNWLVYIETVRDQKLFVCI